MNNQCIVNALTTQNKNWQSIDRDVPYFPSLDIPLETERRLVSEFDTRVSRTKVMR
jgi:hypothetical protein